MGHPGKKDVKRIYGLLMDGLKVYQKNHKTFKDVNEKFLSAEWKNEEH